MNRNGGENNKHPAPDDAACGKDDFENIFNLYYHKIIQFLSRITTPEDAEDLAQEVFDKVSRNLMEFQGKSKISTWIYRIATNTVIDRSRSASFKKSSALIPIQEAFHDAIYDPDGNLRPPSADELVVGSEMNACINEYIEKLPENHQTILKLYYMIGLSHHELAEIMDISVENVKIRLHRARAKLKEALSEGCVFYINEKNALACDRKQVQITPKPHGKTL